MCAAMEVKDGGLDREEVAALLAEHLEEMMAISPRESVHALDLESLRAPEISFWTVWVGETLVGCGALKHISEFQGEIKSMRTARAHRGKGVATAVLSHMIGVARLRGYESLLLETGSMAEFEPARSLYLKHGFTFCPPFAEYVEDPNSVFMKKCLTSRL